MISTGMVESAAKHRALAEELGTRRRALRERIAAALGRWLDQPEAERLAAYLFTVQQGLSVQARDRAGTDELTRIADDAIAGIMARCAVARPERPG